jgi:hypothetical protein
MITTSEDTHSKDKENRRIGIDRRQFSYTHYLPERRAGKDRRRDDDFEYQDSVGNLRHATAGAAFEFLFLHQTHHRGQISQILDSMGLAHSFADNAAYLEDQ